MGPPFCFNRGMQLRCLAIIYLCVIPIAVCQSTTIRRIDFRNARYEQGIRLKNGHWESKGRGGFGFGSVSLESVSYFVSPSCMPECALVEYFEEAVGGSSNQFGVAKVYRVLFGKLELLQRISWDLHFGDWKSTRRMGFDAKKLEFTYPNAHYLDGDAHCCVSAVDVVTMRWDGKKFVRSALHTELTETGKEQGVKIP